MNRLKEGVEISIEGSIYKTQPCSAIRLEKDPDLPERAKRIRNPRHGDTSWISIIITEGKFRQVRKMTAVVGYPTLRLVRVRVGEHHLETMQPSEVVVLDTL